MNTIPVVKRLRNCLPAALLIVVALTGSARAQSEIRIEQITLPPGKVRLVVSHPLGGATNFALQRISTVTNAWISVPGATVRSLGFGQVELLAPRPATADSFFRICSRMALTG